MKNLQKYKLIELILLNNILSIVPYGFLLVFSLNNVQSQNIEGRVTSNKAELRIESSIDPQVEGNADIWLRRSNDSYYGLVSMNWVEIKGNFIPAHNFSFGVENQFTTGADNLKFIRSGFDSGDTAYSNLLLDIKGDGNHDNTSDDPTVNIPSGVKLRFGSTTGGSTIHGAINTIRISTLNLLPKQNNVTKLGSSNFRFKAVYSAGGVYSAGDGRLKKNISKISYGINDVMKLSPAIYNWKDPNNPASQLGLLAQEVNEIIPEAVVKSEITSQTKEIGNKKELKNYAINYDRLLPVLVSAIQEQHSEIENIKQQLHAFINEKSN